MNVLKNILILFISFALLSACSKVYVGKISYDKKHDFNQYETFKFVSVDIDNQSTLEPHMDNIELLLQSIEDEMLARGYKKSQNSDLDINLGIVMEHAQTTRETSIQDAPIYMGQRNYHWESEEIVVSEYEKGTAVVDLIDTKQKKLVWEGTVIGVIDQDQTKMKDRIRKGVSGLFKKYPVVVQ